jgi:ABC-type transport system substrate-binding protein
MACLRFLLPKTPDSLLMGYSPSQWNWIRQNENDVWKNLVRTQALFSEDPLITARYLSDGPFTSGLSPASPPALGRFFGDRIFQKWLSNQKDQKAWLRDPAQAEQILQEAGYRGRS